MSRIYIQPSWVDACSDHNEWSGQSPDDRKRPSHFIGTSANIAAYAEKEEPKKAKEAVKADLRTLPEKRLDSLDLKRSKMDKALASGELSRERYNILLAEWTLQYERAMKRLDKQEGVAHLDDENDFSDEIYAENKVKSLKKDLTVFVSGAIILLTAAMMIF